MAVDEEYLDGLLKSMTDNERDESAEDISGEGLSFDLQSLLGNADDRANEDTSGASKEEMSLEDDWKFSLDDILAQADAESMDENADSPLDLSDWENTEQPAETTEVPKEETYSTGADELDAADLFNGMGDAEPDLSEISGMLGSDGKKEAVDAGMLALLEGIDDVQMDGGYEDADSVFDIFSGSAFENRVDSEGSPKEADEENQGKLSRKERRKDKKKSKPFDKKKQKEEETPTENENAAQDGINVDDLLAGAVKENGEKPQEEKKPGFFARALTYLTQTDEEEEEEQAENKESSEEKKDSKKEKKKKKEDKKKKKNKGNAQEEGAEESEEETEGKVKGKKKAKKEKKEKPPKEKIKEPRVLSTRKQLVLVAFCATIVASILILSNFLPEYADKQNARNAFYKGDYETVYELLYEKQLGDSDRIIFNRAKTVLRLERKLHSYENNLALNRGVEAVDALFQGVSCYYELTASEVYGAREEIDALYQQICSILESNYGISQEEAVQINAYDNETYTRKLNSIISGTEFSLPGEELAPEEPALPQDILSAEEDIIRY